ncbi:hypothetical protein OEZ85_009936 [Tetradesmus obliquus]|uniref:CBM20 domain-containing protein n=1 Tax=Tetradesmus obliquus TaxID=3088 RepID=A0ABY8UEE4_TETOB|nr:hypothetical protein OEZ85_009936 [Tetradesmus obliquus]
MRDGEEPDAQIGVTVADDVRLQHSSEIKQADVSSWSCRSTCSKVYNYALAQWFILGLGVAIAFAAAVPKLGATKGWIRAEYSVKIPAIIIIFIISGLGLKTKALLSAAADLRIHVLVQGLSLAAIPAIGYGIALALRNNGFNDHLADGLVIMACMPTTVSTNVVYTARAAGNEAAALVNAVLGNIIGIFVTPLWLGHFLKVEGVAPYGDVLIELSYTIIAPLIVGQLMQYCTPGVVAWIKKHINTANVSSCCILALVWVTFCNTFSNGSTKQVPGVDVAATVFLGVALFFLFLAVSFVVAWPPPPLRKLRRWLGGSRADVVAVVICGSMKTVALGVPLINVMYKDVPYAGILAMPLIIYHALQSVQRVSASQSARTAHVHQGASKPARAALLVPRAYGAPGTSYDTNPYSQTGSSSQFGGGQRQQQQGSTALASLDQGGAALKAKEQPKMVAVRFWLKFHVDYGQSIRIIGGHEAMGAWNLAKAPFLRWSEGDLWNVTLEVAAGGVIEYKYVVVEGDGTVAASWQRGANNVLALQLNDEEVEVYDNWKNTPGALVLVDGQEITRERKLLAWASDMSLQRSELRRTRMELAQAREEIRVLRAELSVLRMEVSEANIARAAAEARQLELERKNSALRLEIAASNASARSTMEEAARLLNDMSDDDSGMNGGMGMSSSSGMSDAGSGGSPTYASANAPAGAGSSSSGSHGSGGGMFGSLFGFNMPGGNGKGK